MRSKYYYLRFAWAKSMQIGARLGCHQLPERSFFFKQYQFPVCARCSGALLGEIIAVICFLFNFRLPLYVDIIFMCIMFVDWCIQFVGIKESKNLRRFITGLLGGFGCWSAFFKFVINVIHLFF